MMNLFEHIYHSMAEEWSKSNDAVEVVNSYIGTYEGEQDIFEQSVTIQAIQLIIDGNSYEEAKRYYESFILKAGG